MPSLTINDKEVQVPDGITLIQACDIAGVEIPRFCYHDRLSIAGNCRMCLVEVEGGPPKPVASCAAPATEGMKVKTDSEMVKKAREGTMEFLLANHPLDCPICDQGGECDLQDQAYQYGRSESDYKENRRGVTSKNLGTLIKTIMTRCIHCTRCVRFTTDIAGVEELGAVGRGETMEITSYLEKSMTSELSGNVIDLCPVGALTSKPYAFKARSWELKKTDSIDIMDALGSGIRIDSHSLEVMRIIPRVNEDINEEWLSDKARFCYDGLKYQRLDEVFVKENGKFKKSKLNDALDKIKNIIENCKAEEIAALSGPLSSANEILALKSLMEGLKSKNYDCRVNNQALSSQDQGSYLFNSKIEDINESDSLLLIGVNPRKDCPVLNSRITQRAFDKKYKIATIGVDADLTYKYQNLGNNVDALQKLIAGKSEFSKILKNSKKPLIIVGEDAISGKNGDAVLAMVKSLVKEYNINKEEWQGYNFLSKSTGLINGLEVGFDKGNTNKILDNIESNKTKLLFLLGADDGISIEKKGDCQIVYIGSHGDFGANNADIILPGLAFSEKEDIYINLEGRPQKTKRAIFGPKNSKNDSQIIIDIANHCNIKIDFKDLDELEKHLITNILKRQVNETSSNKINLTAKNKIETDEDTEILVKNYDYHLTNAIARSSKTLNKRSQDLQQSQ